MKKSTSVQLNSALQRRLALYSLAAASAGVSALAFSQPAEGEVVYTCAHELIGRNQSFAIDLNHDGIADFTIQNALRKTSAGSYFSAQLGVKPNAAVGGEVLYRFHPYMAAALQKGAVIGTRGPFKGEQNIDMAVVFRFEDEGTYSFGYWLGQSNAYLGLRFKINGVVHYGWARLTTGFNGKFSAFARLTGYAYETEPNTPIVAGNTGNKKNDGENTTIASAGPIDRITESHSPSPTLAALSLGAPGLSIWRRKETASLQ